MLTVIPISATANQYAFSMFCPHGVPLCRCESVTLVTESEVVVHDVNRVLVESSILSDVCHREAVYPVRGSLLHVWHIELAQTANRFGFNGVLVLRSHLGELLNVVSVT